MSAQLSNDVRSQLGVPLRWSDQSQQHQVLGKQRLFVPEAQARIRKRLKQPHGQEVGQREKLLMHNTCLMHATILDSYYMYKKTHMCCLVISEHTKVEHHLETDPNAILDYPGSWHTLAGRASAAPHAPSPARLAVALSPSVHSKGPACLQKKKIVVAPSPPPSSTIELLRMLLVHNPWKSGVHGPSGVMWVRGGGGPGCGMGGGGVP